MAMTCALFRAFPGSPTQPNTVLIYLNRHLCKVADNSFITALYSVYETEQQTLRIARAGHPPPMIYRVSEKKAIELACQGVFPMGIDSYDQVPVTDTKLERGDCLIMYTDGLIERFYNAGKPYKLERLLQKL